MEFSNLNNAEFVKVYSDRIYVWHGACHIAILNKNLERTGDISINFNDCHKAEDLRKVKQTIEWAEDEIFMDEDFTDDMFVNYEYETGQDLEAQA
jgi:zona occludens toxin (predicted ATPase)